MGDYDQGPFILYRYISCESYSQFDSLPLTSLTLSDHQFPMNQAASGFFSYAESLEVGLQGQDALLKAKGLTTGCGEYTDNTNNEDNNPSNCGKLNFAKAHFQIGGNSGTGLKSTLAGAAGAGVAVPVDPTYTPPRAQV